MIKEQSTEKRKEAGRERRTRGAKRVGRRDI